MSALRRFPLHYDDLFDSDIHELLVNTPVKRRSELFRALIRAGLAAQSSTPDKGVPTVHPTLRRGSIANDTEAVSQRGPVRFEPPS